VASAPAPRRVIAAKDVLADPTILSDYPHRLILLRHANLIGDFSDLLAAAELLEEQGWSVQTSLGMMLLLRRT